MYIYIHICVCTYSISTGHLFQEILKRYLVTGATLHYYHINHFESQHFSLQRQPVVAIYIFTYICMYVHTAVAQQHQTTVSSRNSQKISRYWSNTPLLSYKSLRITTFLTPTTTSSSYIYIYMYLHTYVCM